MTPDRERAIREILREAFTGMPVGMAIEMATAALLALPDPVRDAAREVVEHAQDARKVFAEELIERAIVLRPETFYALRAALEESEHE